MMYPAFKFMAWVMIHTPSAQMYFYDCPTKGRVVDFRDVNMFSRVGTSVVDVEYLVAFDCPKKVVRDWLKVENLRPLSK